ncbi:SufE family protein [Cesiribacter andamanensis]|uniref:Cysteine desulfuration protein sufE n=1 Tax=Cesiribacter andamanensis AMV16 TaxID=1279009 RepID=M7NQB0_9BACT|nr:SufE family protein [Cesiribacter andamanensis]EMR03910.1 Cysteine desulfuration protein sufE [Cesiribacter andamanensis AMV16]
MEKAPINSIQDEIIDEFSLFEDDRNGKLEYLIDLGEKLPELEDAHKLDENLIKGCQSKVWLVSEPKGERLYYRADSNTAITKGLIALLIRVLSGQKIGDIARADLYFIRDIGMNTFIGSQRSNGFANMINQMKLEAALAYRALENKE